MGHPLEIRKPFLHSVLNWVPSKGRGRWGVTVEGWGLAKELLLVATIDNLPNLGVLSNKHLFFTSCLGRICFSPEQLIYFFLSYGHCEPGNGVIFLIDLTTRKFIITTVHCCLLIFPGLGSYLTFICPWLWFSSLPVSPPTPNCVLCLLP